jgi:Ca-activated chloride channel family protein
MVEAAEYPWYSVHWFYPSVISSFHFVHPEWLYFILALPLLFGLRWLLVQKFGKRLMVALTPQEWKTSRSSILLAFIQPLLLILALALMLLAMARPQRTSEKVEQWTEGIDIMLAIDISQSMRIEDFTPNRLEAAKQVAIDFINGRFQDRIGIVVFSGEAYSLAPLTTDYDLLRQYIKTIDFSLIDVRGTAIGSALAVVLNRMQETTAKSKICILLSDGDSNAGNIDPLTAAELAAQAGVKVYTIIVGREGRVPFGKDFFGRPQYLENTVDEKTMQQIATITDGRYYRATNNRALQQVFDEIDAMEKSEIKESRYLNTADYYFIYLRWALVLYVLWMASKLTFLNNLLTD